MRILHIHTISAFMLGILITVAGCSSIIDAHKQKAPFMALYYSGDVKQAATDLLEKSESREGTGDELIWCLEAGTSELDAGEYEKSLKSYARSETILKDFRDRAVINARKGSVEVGAAATNANALPYKGMALDKVMLNAYKALGYWGSNNPEGAQVELRRMRDAQKNVLKEFQDEIDKLQKEIDGENIENKKNVSKRNKSKSKSNTSISFESIVKNPVIKEAYQSSEQKANKLYGNLGNPFVTYLSAMGYLLENNYGEAMVDFRNLYKMIPKNRLIQKDYVRCAKEIGDKIPEELSKISIPTSPLNTKIVYLLFFNGRAPALNQRKFQIILPFVGYTGIAFPQYEYFKPPFSSLQLNFKSNNKFITEKTEQIVDFDSVMSQEYHMRLPTMITRLVVSTLTKEIGSYIAVAAASQAGGTGAQIGAYALTGLYKWLFNTADTRCWETLPQEVEVAHIPIPANRVFTLTPITTNKTVKIEAQKSLKPGISHSGGNCTIQLKKSTKVAIVYIRALSADKVIYKLFEME